MLDFGRFAQCQAQCVCNSGSAPRILCECRRPPRASTLIKVGGQALYGAFSRITCRSEWNSPSENFPKAVLLIDVRRAPERTAVTALSCDSDGWVVHVALHATDPPCCWRLASFPSSLASSCAPPLPLLTGLLPLSSVVHGGSHRSTIRRAPEHSPPERFVSSALPPPYGRTPRTSLHSQRPLATPPARG